MQRMRPAVVVLAVALATLSACNRDASGDKGGPGEKAGRAVDRALDKAGKAVEKAGRNMQDASKGEK
jgi:predicted small secreted protein